jgi:hypothetical protein
MGIEPGTLKRMLAAQPAAKPRVVPGVRYRSPPTGYGDAPIEFYRRGLQRFGDRFRFEFGPAQLNLFTRSIGEFATCSRSHHWCLPRAICAPKAPPGSCTSS